MAVVRSFCYMYVPMIQPKLYLNPLLNEIKQRALVFEGLDKLVFEIFNFLGAVDFFIQIF